MARREVDFVPEPTEEASPCDSCREPGACCRAFTLSRRFPVGFTRDQVRTCVRDGLDPKTGLRTTEELPHFEPLRPAAWFAARGRHEPDAVKWLFSCDALGPDGRCTIYEGRPKVCRDYEPRSDAMCAEFRGPWRGVMHRLGGTEDEKL